MFEIDATNLPRFMACNGSAKMVGLLPDINFDTSARDEGNAAHYMAQTVFNGEFQIEELIDRKAPNGFYMTADMAENVMDYLEHIGLNKPGHVGGMEIDTSFGNEFWRVNARTDHAAYYQAENLLKIDDLKYGWSIVEVVENWTLIAHAMGYCIRHNIAPSKIVLTIHQPRPYHPDGTVRPWEIDYNQLLEYYNRLMNVLNNPGEELRTGPHCRKCHALANCPAARKAGMNAIDAMETTYFDDNISNDLLSFELDTLSRAQEMLKNRKEALEELATHRIKSGQIVENYAVEPRLGKTKWNDGITPEMMFALTGKDIADKKLPTPKEAMRRGVPEDVIKPLTDRPISGVKLTRVSATTKAERLFNKG